MTPFSIALAAGLMVLAGLGIRYLGRMHQRRRARARCRQETARLDREVEQAEILRHESELRTGEFDMQG
jgi:hypothetical protein